MSQDVVVVGAGVNGLAAAREIARAGHRVEVLERFMVGNDRGSSHGPVRIFRAAYEEALWAQRVEQARLLWSDLEAESGMTLLRPLAGVNVGERLDVVARALEGIPHHLVDGAEAARRFPQMRFDPSEPVLIEPGAAVTDAAATLEALAASVRARGGTISENVRVLGIDEASDHVEIATEGAARRADVVVVTAGAWVPDLLGERVPQVRPSVETSVYCPVSETVPIMIERGTPLRYSLPIFDGRLRSGFSLGDQWGHPDDEASVEDHAVASRVRDWLVSRLKVEVGQPTLVQRCMYTMTPDESFVLERHGRIVIGSACSGHGFKLAPWTGARIAELVDA